MTGGILRSPAQHAPAAAHGGRFRHAYTLGGIVALALLSAMYSSRSVATGTGGSGAGGYTWASAASAATALRAQQAASEAADVGRGLAGGGPLVASTRDDDTAAEAAAARAAAARLASALRANAHVLLVSHDMYMQGAQFFLLRLAVGLRALGWGRIEFLSPADGPMRKTLNELGFHVHVATGPLPDWLVRHGGAYSLIHYNTVVMCWAYLHRVDPANPPGPPLPGKALWTVHESQPKGRGLALRGRCPRLDDAFAAADAVFFAAHATQEVYEQAGWLRPPPAQDVIRYGIEIDAYDAVLASTSVEAARRAVGIPGNAVVIMSVGTLCTRKGQLDLATAFVRVLAAYTAADPAAASARPLHLYLVGAERQPWVKDYEAAVEAVAASRAAGGRVHVVDRTSDPAVTRLYMRSADVHALHASDESMPFVCMETMALGVPQLATAVFGIPELVRDGQDGLLYAYRGNATDELEARMLELVRDPVRRAALGRSAAERVRAQFTGPRMAAAYDAKYLAALTGGLDAPAAAAGGG